MDKPLMTLINVCILGVGFGLFASFVDCQEPWQRPVLSPPPTLWWIPPPPPPISPTRGRRRHPPPPPTPQLQPPLASPPSISPSNGRPFFSVPPPGQGEQTHPQAGESWSTHLAKIIGWMFLGVAIIMQVLVVIFLVIKRKQLFNPENAY